MKNRYQKIKKNVRGRGPNALWFLLIVLAGLMAYLFWYNSENRNIERINYTTFLSQLEAGGIDSLAIQDQQVQGVLKDGKKFETYIIPHDDLWRMMEEKDVKITVYPAEKQSWFAYFIFSLLPFLLLLGLLFFRQAGSGTGPGKIFSVGKSKARLFLPDALSITFDDVAGVHDAKEDLKDIVEFLKNPKKFERLGAKIPRGVLLNGAPGNGKTLLAKAVAGEASCPFFSISGSDFVEVFVGVGASRVRDLFIQARKNAPCIVFIDEVDAVGRQRGVGLGGGNDEREQTLNQLLAEMDGFATEHRAVIVLAATNRPDVLDKALLRPGRFDRVIEVPYPDLVSREEILSVHAKEVTLSPDIDLRKIARGTPGFSGADLKNLINESALAASKAGKDSVEVSDFEHARDKVLLGAERKTMIISEEEKKRTATHESGHTLLNVLLPKTDPFHKVTIIPRGRALGVSWSLPEADKHSQSREALLSRIMVCLGGQLAEKIMFSEQTTGASDDIDKATKIAKAMVCYYGMSSLGPVTFGQTDKHPYLGGTRHSSDYSEATAQEIDVEIRKIIMESNENAEKLLREHKDKLELLAKNLLEKETLQADEVYELLEIQPRETFSLGDKEKRKE